MDLFLPDDGERDLGGAAAYIRDKDDGDDAQAPAVDGGDRRRDKRQYHEGHKTLYIHVVEDVRERRGDLVRSEEYLVRRGYDGLERGEIFIPTHERGYPVQHSLD